MNIKSPESAALHHVTVVGYDKVLGTSISIPMEMLNAADLIARIRGLNSRSLKMQIVSPDGRDINIAGGLSLVCDTALHDIAETDMVILPGLWGNPRGVVRRHAGMLVPWLQDQAGRGTLICAAGTGSYFLAEAGLLNGKVATTHWYYFDQFAARYPGVELHRERFITKAGNLYCTGSINAVRDVMLHFIEIFYDDNVANQVSRHFTHELKSTYAAGFLKNTQQNFHEDETIIEVQEWMHRHYNEGIDMALLSHEFGLSQRSLNRRFKQATGRSPLRYLQQLRIDKAKELLKTSNLAIAEVAYRVGYPDNSYFSALFKRSVTLSPKDYRSLVRKKIFKVDI